MGAHLSTEETDQDAEQGQPDAQHPRSHSGGVEGTSQIQTLPVPPSQINPLVRYVCHNCRSRGTPDRSGDEFTCRGCGVTGFVAVVEDADDDEPTDDPLGVLLNQLLQMGLRRGVATDSLTTLMQLLTSQDGISSGPPPTATDAIEALKVIVVEEGSPCRLPHPSTQTDSFQTSVIAVSFVKIRMKLGIA
eukprot:GHVN01056722.1.p2 GENE.GHVN01056722.1~~GHVN01056722.1.p2  ORF type:complete len:190 (-),score=16.72 GHVN01056722.1:1316-1885(-)